MALHKQHGCRPSNVCFTASARECVRKLSASIVVHATDCSAAHGAPVIATSSSTITPHFPSRTNTRENYTLLSESQVPIMIVISRDNEARISLERWRKSAAPEAAQRAGTVIQGCSACFKVFKSSAALNGLVRKACTDLDGTWLTVVFE